MLDEIYVKKNICYKGGKIVGADIQSDDNNSSVNAAATIQTFMIRSIFSGNKDVVGLFPVTNLKCELLYTLVLQVLK